MKTQIGRTGIDREELQLYFDGELTGAEAAELAARVEAEPELKAELQQLGLLKDLVQHSLAERAAEVPDARFAQIWDEIDRTIDRDARQARPDPVAATFWSRLSTALRPLRWPALATAAAVAIGVVAMNSTPTSEPNNAPAVASDDPQAGEQPVATPPAKPAVEPDRVAEADAPAEELRFPAPLPGDADIETIDFGGRSGRIARTGTVTVLYVEEDDEPIEKEHSL